MLVHDEAGGDTRLVPKQSNAAMKIQAGSEHVGCSKVAESPDHQVVLQRQEDGARLCSGSPRRATATRLSSGSAGKDVPRLMD